MLRNSVTWSSPVYEKMLNAGVDDGTGLVVTHRTETGESLRDVRTSACAVVASMDADNTCPSRQLPTRTVDVGGDRKGCHLVIQRDVSILASIKGDSPDEMLRKCPEHDVQPPHSTSKSDILLSCP